MLFKREPLEGTKVSDGCYLSIGTGQLTPLSDLEKLLQFTKCYGAFFKYMLEMSVSCTINFYWYMYSGFKLL